MFGIPLDPFNDSGQISAEMLRAIAEQAAAAQAMTVGAGNFIGGPAGSVVVSPSGLTVESEDGEDFFPAVDTLRFSGSFTLEQTGPGEVLVTGGGGIQVGQVGIGEPYDTSELLFDSADGLVVSQVDSYTRVDLLPATALQAGGVTTTTQTWAGNKTFEGGVSFPADISALSWPGADYFVRQSAKLNGPGNSTWLLTELNADVADNTEFYVYTVGALGRVFLNGRGAEGESIGFQTHTTDALGNYFFVGGFTGKYGTDAAGTTFTGGIATTLGTSVAWSSITGTPTTLAGYGITDGGGGSYTDEAAQDAVGGILTDSGTINFAYNDAGPSITGDVILAGKSITEDGSGLELDGDEASPGNSKLYGTNGSGVKGWYAQPSGSGSRTEGTLAAAGSTQGDAAAITTDAVDVSGADGTKGVILPSTAGAIVALRNNALSTLKVYPPSGATLGGGAINDPDSLTAGGKKLYVRITSTAWYSVAIT